MTDTQRNKKLNTATRLCCHLVLTSRCYALTLAAPRNSIYSTRALVDLSTICAPTISGRGLIVTCIVHSESP